MKYIKTYEKVAGDKYITTSYYTITPESAENGDFEDHGWYDEEGESMLPDEFEIEEGITAVDKAVDFLENVRYTTEPSSSEFHDGIYYSSVDPDQNYTTGEDTYYTCHLKGFTTEEEFEIYKKITKWEEKQLKRDIKKYNV